MKRDSCVLGAEGMARTRPSAITTAVTFLAAGVADDVRGDFFGSAVVILLLCIGLWRLGVRFHRRRRP